MCGVDSVEIVGINPILLFGVDSVERLEINPILE